MKHMTYRLLAQHMVAMPLSIEPSRASLMVDVARSCVSLAEAVDASSFEANAFKGTRSRGQINRVSNGAAIVSVQGLLVNRGAWIGEDWFGVTSYEGIAAKIEEAVSDPDVSTIVLDIDSPGGEATGMFALTQKVREANAKKPVVAVVNDMAASAAYGISSGASEIVISPTSFVGSIGVVMVHMDHSGELEQMGLKPTILQAGSHKTDGTPLKPLSDTVKAGLQSKIDTLYETFLETVATGRGSRLSLEAARGTQAEVYIGRNAIDAGLADRFGTFEDVLSNIQNQTARQGLNRGDAEMADTKSLDAEAQKSAQPVAQDPNTASASDIKARISAILSCEEAKGREAQANILALETDMPVEAAKKLLEASPLSSVGSYTKPIFALTRP